MCGACPGGTSVSPTTARLNDMGRKRRLLAELRRCLAPGCTLTLVGDSWTLRRRTGRQDVFHDIENLLVSFENGQVKDWVSLRAPRDIVRNVLGE